MFIQWIQPVHQIVWTEMKSTYLLTNYQIEKHQN